MTASRDQLKALLTLEQLRQYRVDQAAADLQRATRAVQLAEADLQACRTSKSQTEQLAELAPGSPVDTQRLQRVRRFVQALDSQAEGLQDTLGQTEQVQERHRDRARLAQVALEQSRKRLDEVRDSLATAQAKQILKEADELWILRPKNPPPGESNAD